MSNMQNINVQVINENDTYGEFVMDLLPRGYGYTVGTPLRRALLTYMQGSAITSVKISGVKHEFSTISGVKEDVLRILLNLKKVVIRNHTDDAVILKLSVKGPAVVTAGDIEENANAEVINKDLVIAELTSKTATLDMELTVENGIGYVIADNLRRTKIGTLPLDANFSPVERVAMDITPTRRGQETDLDKLVFRVWTKGNVKPSEAMYNAIQHIKDIFAQMTGLSAPQTVENDTKKVKKTVVKKKATKKTK